MVIERKIKFGIIGCGRISHAHCEACKNLREEVMIEAIADINKKHLVEFSRKYQVKKIFSDYNDLLKDKEIDAVIICLPYYLHKQVTIDALRSGKHVLVEKPMALNYIQAQKIVEIAEKENRKLMIGQSRRFCDAVMDMKKRIDKADIGELFRMIINFLVFFEEAPTDWWNKKDMAGELITLLQGSHSVDTVVWFFNRLPIRVYSINYIKKFPVVDEGDILLDFGDATASIHLSLNTKPAIHEILAIGTSGLMKLSEYPLNKAFNFEYRLEKNGKCILDGKQEPSNYTIQLKEFVRSLRENREPHTGGKEILKTMRVIDAILESISSNKVVEL